MSEQPKRNPITNQTADSEAALREQVESKAIGFVTAETESTEAGNYFVANYPPFSFWAPSYNQSVDQLLDAPPQDPSVPLGVYYHIPFCRKRCHFCYFRVYTDKNADEIRTYIDSSMRELEYYASKPYVAGRKPEYIYFGGGTPSYLSPSQLIDLTDKMKAVLPWDEAREIAFECEPGTLNEKKLQTLRDIGITRLSLGIESFDDHVLELNGRAHRSGEVDRAYNFARDIGFPQINIDLIAGMMDETEDNWFRSVDKAIEFAPEMVTIYQMEIPYNTAIYREMKDAGKTSAPVADWATKRRWVSEAFDRFVAAGYTVTSAYTVVKNPEKYDFVYRDALFGGADLLPIGVASFGHVGGIHLQNQHNIEPYVDQVVGTPEAAGQGRGLFRSYVTDPEERFVREFVLRMKLGSVDCGEYRAKFGIDPSEFFAKQLAQMVADGFAQIDGDIITVTRDGLLQIDRTMHGFFLERHRGARYA